MKKIIYLFTATLLLWGVANRVTAQNATCETALTVTVASGISADDMNNWYKFVPAQAGVYTITESGSLSMYGNVYTGTCRNLNGVSWFKAQAAFYLDAGQTCYIEWYNYSGEPQAWELAQPANPEGMTCQTAQVVTLSNTITPDISGENWYAFTPAQDGVYQITFSDMSGSVTVYKGTCNNLEEIENFGSLGGSFYARAGQTYYLSVDAYGSLSWSLSKPANAEGLTCQTAIGVTPSDSIGFDIIGYNWYVFTPTSVEEGFYLVNSEIISADVYTGICEDLDELGHGSILVFYAQAGESYYFSWEYPGYVQEYWSLVNYTGNTEGLICQTAKTVIPSDSIATTTFGTNWYVFTPTAAQEGVYTVATEDMMTIEVLMGSCSDMDQLEDVSPGSEASFYAQAGKTYYFNCLNYLEISQIWSLTKSTAGDYEGIYCQTAEVLTAPANDITIDFGQEYGDYWYAFTPATTAVYSVSNCGKSLDGMEYSSVSVYGGSCDNFTIEAIPGDCGSNGSIATFQAQAGNTYYIEWYVEFEYMASDYTMQWDLREEDNPLGMICQAATPLTDTASSIQASNHVSWYEFTPSETAIYTAECPSEDAWAAVLTACEITPANIVAGGGDRSVATFQAQAGTPYYIVLGGNVPDYLWNLTIETNPVYAQHINIDHKLTVNSGEQAQIDWSVDGFYTGPVWESRNTGVATVAAGGVVTGQATGQTYVVFTITVNAGTLTDSCLVKVPAPPVAVTGITIKHNTSLLTGNTEQLTANVLPGNAANKGVNWETRDASVATVNASGLVTAQAAGQTYIIATTVDGGFKDSCLVVVTNTEVNVTGVTLNKTQLTLDVGAFETLLATVVPNSATNQNVRWSTNSMAIATVDSISGKVTGISPGQAVVTVTTQDGGRTATCAVTVRSTGLNDIASAKAELKVYPNPVMHGELKIKNTEWLDNGLIRIYDLTGRKVGEFRSTAEVTGIDISYLSKGIYLLRIGSATVKVVKQ